MRRIRKTLAALAAVATAMVALVAVAGPASAANPTVHVVHNTSQRLGYSSYNVNFGNGSRINLTVSIYNVNTWTSRYNDQISTNGTEGYMTVGCFNPSGTRISCRGADGEFRTHLESKYDSQYLSCGIYGGGTCSVDHASTIPPAGYESHDNWSLESQTFDPSDSTGCKDPVFSVAESPIYVDNGNYGSYTFSNRDTTHYRVCDTSG